MDIKKIPGISQFQRLPQNMQIILMTAVVIVGGSLQVYSNFIKPQPNKNTTEQTATGNTTTNNSQSQVAGVADSNSAIEQVESNQEIHKKFNTDLKNLRSSLERFGYQTDGSGVYNVGDLDGRDQYNLQIRGAALGFTIRQNLGESFLVKKINSGLEFKLTSQGREHSGIVTTLEGYEDNVSPIFYVLTLLFTTGQYIGIDHPQFPRTGMMGSLTTNPSAPLVFAWYPVDV